MFLFYTRIFAVVDSMTTAKLQARLNENMGLVDEVYENITDVDKDLANSVRTVLDDAGYKPASTVGTGARKKKVASSCLGFL